MKFHTSTYNYDYSFPAVSLAYFLRYPNPCSTHVLTEDVISRHFDPVTQRLYTTRLHLKQSKIPAWILGLLPRNILGNNRGPNGEAQNFVLENSVIDIREGWMETESQNLQYTGVLKAVEKQRFTRSSSATDSPTSLFSPTADKSLSENISSKQETTDVSTTITFVSRLGQSKRRVGVSANGEETEEQKRGFFSWSTAKLQGSIEGASLERARKSLVRSKEGMDIVLERMRQGGLAAVLEGMRRDRELVVGAKGRSGIGLLGGLNSDQSTDRTSESRWRKIWEDATSGDDGFDV
ncbi:MAG: hypothetical protein LQ340_001261 [Diploschistes diacapsis]|nr:MAG: hypothetical protein LQ340_001261 [Diploschistes diacapsis]